MTESDQTERDLHGDRVLANIEGRFDRLDALLGLVSDKIGSLNRTIWIGFAILVVCEFIPA